MANGAAFERALEHTLGIEKGFVNDPNDRGGATRWGITEAVARANGYEGRMEDLPPSVARDIYRREYWDRVAGNEVALWYEPAAAELFDTAVNMGWQAAGRFFQRALNALNRNATLYADLGEDGQLGAVTLQAMRTLRDDLSKRVLVKMLDAQQGAHYLDIMKRDPTQEAFARGWFDKRVGG